MNLNDKAKGNSNESNIRSTMAQQPVRFVSLIPPDSGGHIFTQPLIGANTVFVASGSSYGTAKCIIYIR